MAKKTWASGEVVKSTDLNNNFTEVYDHTTDTSDPHGASMTVSGSIDVPVITHTGDVAMGTTLDAGLGLVIPVSAVVPTSVEIQCKIVYCTLDQKLYIYDPVDNAWKYSAAFS